MAQEQDITFEILANTKRSENNVIKLRQEIERLTKEVAEEKITAGQAEAQIKKFAAAHGIAATQVTQTKRAVQQMSQTAARVVSTGGGMNFFIQQVGFLASDARYGLLGIGNNLSLLVALLPQVAAEAKAAGTTFRAAFGRALLGPGGLILAMQVLIVLLPEIIKWFGQWRKGLTSTQQAMKDATAAVAKKTRQLDIYQNILNSTNVSERVRLFIMDRLAKQGLILRDIDGQRIDDLRIINSLIDKQRQGIILKARAQVIEAKLADKLAKAERGRFLKTLDYMAVGLEAIRAFTLEFTTVDLALMWKNLKEISLGFVKALFDSTKWAYGHIRDFLGRLGIDLQEWATEFNIVWEGVGAQIEQGTERAMNPIRKMIEELGEENLAVLNDEIKALIEQLEALYGEMADTDSVKTAVKNAEWAINKFKTLAAATQNIVDQLMGTSDREKLAREAREGMSEILDARANALDGLAEDDPLYKYYEDLYGKLIDQYNTYIQKKTELVDKKEIAASVELRRQRINDLQETMGAMADFLSNAAQLNEKNKGLAKAAIVASGATSILGAWESWLVKDPTFQPAPIKVAGAIATTAAVIAATASSLKSIDSGSIGGASGGASGGQSREPNFNIIGATGTNQLQQTINQRLAEQGDRRVVLVNSELQKMNGDNEVAIEQSSLG